MLRLLPSTRTTADDARSGFSCVCSRGVGADRVTLAGELHVLRVPETDDALRLAGAGNGHDRAIVAALKRHYRDAGETQTRLSSAALLSEMTAERDELLTRVVALEQELLDLVYQPPASVGAERLREARPA